MTIGGRHTLSGGVSCKHALTILCHDATATVGLNQVAFVTAKETERGGRPDRESMESDRCVFVTRKTANPDDSCSQWQTQLFLHPSSTYAMYVLLHVHACSCLHSAFRRMCTCALFRCCAARRFLRMLLPPLTTFNYPLNFINIKHRVCTFLIINIFHALTK